MPKYVGGLDKLPSRQKMSGAEISANVGSSLSQLFGKLQQDELIKEASDPNTSLQRKNEIYLKLDPKSAIKSFQQQQQQNFIQKILGESEQPTERNPQMNMNIEKGFHKGVPNVSQLREQLGNQDFSPVPNEMNVNENIPDVGMQEQVDSLDAQRQEVKKLQKQAFATSFANPSAAAKLQSQANEKSANIRAEEKNRAIVKSAALRAEATNNKTAQRAKQQQLHEVLPIQQKAMESYKSSQDQMFALRNQLESVKNGDVSVWSSGNLSRMFEEAGYPTLALAAETEGVALFKTNAKTIFSGAKEIFPGRVTNFDAGIFKEMMAQVGRNELANEVSIQTLMLPQEIKSEESKYTMQLLSENPNISALQLNSDVFNHMNEFRDKKYEEWHEKLDQWEISQKPQKRSIFQMPSSSEKPRKSLEELRREYIPQ